MDNRFIKNGKLKDTAIIKALHTASDWYEDGAIVEARDLLVDIVSSIDEFMDGEQE